MRTLKTVITAGGVGTRLLPFSKEIPKEMSPIITQDPGSSVQVKPIIQAIYEQLYADDIRDFLIVVGRGKRAIQDHFTPDQGFLELLAKNGKGSNGLDEFYEKVKSSNLVFVSQPEPLGFGDAVLRTRPYITDDFLVHAGDTYVISNDHIKRLFSVHEKYHADATIMLQDVRDARQFGVVLGEESEEGILKIEEAEEKPETPKSHTAIMPMYIFKESIFNLLSVAKPGKGGEIQLTDAIQELASSGKVMGVKLRADEVRLDIGSPETLMEALRLSSSVLRSPED